MKIILRVQSSYDKAKSGFKEPNSDIMLVIVLFFAIPNYFTHRFTRGTLATGLLEYMVHTSCIAAGGEEKGLVYEFTLSRQNLTQRNNHRIVVHHGS